MLFRSGEAQVLWRNASSRHPVTLNLQQRSKRMPARFQRQHDRYPFQVFGGGCAIHGSAGETQGSGRGLLKEGLAFQFHRLNPQDAIGAGDGRGETFTVGTGPNGPQIERRIEPSHAVLVEELHALDQRGDRIRPHDHDDAELATGVHQPGDRSQDGLRRWPAVDRHAMPIMHARQAVGTDGEFVRTEVYANVVRSFERWPVALFYIVANLLLGLHLSHGAWSIFQSLGWNNPRFNAWRRAFARGFAAVVVIGNVSFPIAVLIES